MSETRQERRLKRKKEKRKKERNARLDVERKEKAEFQAQRSNVEIIAVRRGGPDNREVLVGVRSGVYGSRNGPAIPFDEDAIIDACEPGDAGTRALGAILTKLGLLALSQLTRHNLAYGVDGLAKSFARFAGIKIDDLIKEAAEEAASADSVSREDDTGTHDGVPVVVGGA